MPCRWALSKLPLPNAILHFIHMPSRRVFLSRLRRENEQLHVYLNVITTSSLGSWRGKQEFIFGLKDFAKSLPVRQTVTCAGFQERFVHNFITALLQVVATLEFMILWAAEEKPSIGRRAYFQEKSGHKTFCLKTFTCSPVAKVLNSIVIELNQSLLKAEATNQEPRTEFGRYALSAPTVF